MKLCYKCSFQPVPCLNLSQFCWWKDFSSCSMLFLSQQSWICQVYILRTLVAGLLARSRYPEGPVTGHLGTGFSWFPCVYKWMLRWFPRLQVATACFSCSPSDLNFLDLYFIFMYMHNNHCDRATAYLQLDLLLLLLSSSLSSSSSSSNFSILSFGWQIFTYPGMQ